MILNDNETLASFLAHLWRGGNWNFICTDKYVDGIGEAVHALSYWQNVSPMSNASDIKISHTRIDGSGVFFGVHPSTQIPPCNKTTGNTDPRYIRSQLDYLAAANCLFGEFDGIS